MSGLPALAHVYGIHKPYVPIAHLEDYLRVGWMPLPARAGGAVHPYHQDWAVHVVWPCKCRMVIPGKELCGND